MSFKKIHISSKDKVFASFKELSLFLDWKRNFTQENAFFTRDNSFTNAF